MSRKLKLYDPFREMWNWPDDMGKLFWGLGAHEGGENPLTFAPPIDVAEDKEALTIRAELPGLNKDDLKITVREGVLTLSGEKKLEKEEKQEKFYHRECNYGSFVRSFSLPKTVDPEHIQASMKEGVLELKVPKKPEAQEKHIEVKVA